MSVQKPGVQILEAGIMVAHIRKFGVISSVLEQFGV
jgi:hypothetical protein